jgi:hypothetical protein
MGMRRMKHRNNLGVGIQRRIDTATYKIKRYQRKHVYMLDNTTIIFMITILVPK